MKNYIGLACTAHDPALAVVNSKGEIVFAEASERYLQNKRAWNSIPDDLVRMEKIIDEYCEDGAEIVLANTWSDKVLKRTRFLTSTVMPLMKNKIPRDEYEFYQNLMTGVVSNLDHVGSNFRLRYHEKYPDKEVVTRGYNHHLTHAATACYCSPFEEAVCAVIDASGEFSSTGFYHYKNGKVHAIKEMKRSLPSIGLFYSHLCHACGFDPNKGEEWKIMGLAPYGKFDEDIYKKLAAILYVKKGRLKHNGSMSKMFIELRNMKRKDDEPILSSADLAYTGQFYFTEIVKDLLIDLYDLKLSNNLVLSGGCALNSACNGKIVEMTPFEDLFVYSAPGDDGNAIGAALLAYYDDNAATTARAQYQTPYLGSVMSEKTKENVKTYANLSYKELSTDEIIKRTASFIAEGKIIGWVQGRAEFGPRALGNRSILADPRTEKMKDTLNARVKFREEYRPFAPSILHEHGPDYFEDYQETPYMERALLFKEEMRSKVPAVVHVDGTGRLQSVKREWNERYYDLIKAFYEKTGVPILLNTSFNVMGKPIVHSVEDALAVFFTSGIDVLVIDNLVFTK